MEGKANINIDGVVYFFETDRDYRWVRDRLHEGVEWVSFKAIYQRSSKLEGGTHIYSNPQSIGEMTIRTADIISLTNPNV